MQCYSIESKLVFVNQLFIETFEVDLQLLNYLGICTLIFSYISKLDLSSYHIFENEYQFPLCRYPTADT